MSLTTIKLTEFHVEKLRCIGGEGRSSPYRITVYDGITLGQIGCVAGSVADIILENAHLWLDAANHDSFERQGFEHRGPMGFKRLLNMFGM